MSESKKYKYTFSSSKTNEKLSFIADSCMLTNGFFIMKNAKTEKGTQQVKEAWIKSETIDIVCVEDIDE